MMSISRLQTLVGHTSDVTCCEFYGRSVLYTGSSDKTIRVWKWKDGSGFQQAENSPLLGHKYGVTGVRVSPKGDVMASSSVDGTTILWKASSLTRIRSLVQDAGEAVRSVAFSPDGCIIVTAGDSGSVCVWNIATFNLVSILRFHEDAVHSLCFSPDSQLLITACTLGNVRLSFNNWANISEVGESSSETEPIYILDAAHDLGVLSADFSSRIVSGKDSKTTIYTAATCGTDHFIKVWRIVSTSPDKGDFPQFEPTVTVELLHSVSAHGSSVTCVRFSMGGALLVSASLDKNIKVWTPTLICKSTLAEHSRYVNCIAFNKDSAILCSGSNDRTVIIWDMVGDLTLDSNIAEPHSLLNNLISQNIPDEFLCPITHELMIDPVMCIDGFVYERRAIEAWLESGHTRSPMTNAELESIELVENDQIKEAIKDFAAEHGLS